MLYPIFQDGLCDLEEELTILARLAGQQAPRICLSLA